MCGYYAPASFHEKNEFFNEYQRIYIGSEYCSTFLYKFEKNIDEIMMNLGNIKKISIVFPLIQETNWKILEKICCKLSVINNNVDEIIVNDIGTLVYCAKILGNRQIVLGKLFCKSPRDPRINMWDFDGINNTKVLSESVFDTDYFRILMKKYNINRVEMECISNEYVSDICNNNSSYFVDIHYPYVYITSGTICPLNSISDNNKIQLINKILCSNQCMHTMLRIQNPVLTNDIISRGNVYMYKTNIDKNIFEFSAGSKIRLVIDELFYRENDWK